MRERIEVFRAVAQAGSFTEAAHMLSISQPAVSVRIRQLEEEMQVRLFDRHPRRVTLTPAGVVALDYAERILALHEEMRVNVARLGLKARSAG